MPVTNHTHTSLNPFATPFSPPPPNLIPNMVLIGGDKLHTRKINTDENVVTTLLFFSITIALLLFCFIVKDVYLKVLPRVNLFKSLYLDINYEIPIIFDDNEGDSVNIDFEDINNFETHHDYTCITYLKPNIITSIIPVTFTLK